MMELKVELIVTSLAQVKRWGSLAIFFVSIRFSGNDDDDTEDDDETDDNDEDSDDSEIY